MLVVKKRSFVRRHSSRGKRTRQSSHDSPRLDRHPSLLFSTTRLQSGGSARRIVRPQPSPVVKTCSLSVTKPPPPAGRETTSEATPGETTQEATARKATPEATDSRRRESSGSNASSIGTCHDLRPSPSAYSVTRGGGALHPEGNRSSSSTETAAAAGGVEVSCPRDDAAVAHRQRRLGAKDDQALLTNRALDVSRVNLLRTTPSENELSVRRQRLNDGPQDGHRSDTVDRLSPASCRQRAPPQSPDITAPADGSNHRQLDQRHPEATVLQAGGSGDLIILGLSALAVLLLTSPTMVVGLVIALRTAADGVGGSFDGRPVGVDVAFALHAVAYVTSLVRPLIYFAFSSTLRRSLVALLRCRRASSD